MKKTILLPAVASLALIFSACSGESSEKAPAPAPETPEIAEPERFEEFEVDHDTIAKTTFTFGKQKFATTEISRIVSTDSLDAYLSMRVYSSEAYLSLNSQLTDLAYQIYSDATGQTVKFKKATKTQDVINAIDAIKANFNDSILANAADSLSFFPGSGIAIDLRPVYATGSYVTYSIFGYNFSGGSRPETDYYLMTFPLNGGAPFDFDKIVKKKGHDKVRRLLLDQLAEANGMNTEDYLDYLAEWMAEDIDSITVAPNLSLDNYPLGRAALSEDGLTISYPRYSIGPDYDALPTFTIPRDSLKGLLNY